MGVSLQAGSADVSAALEGRRTPKTTIDPLRRRSPASISPPPRPPAPAPAPHGITRRHPPVAGETPALQQAESYCGAGVSPA